MKHTMKNFSTEIFEFLVLLIIFTFIPLNQLILQGSIIVLTLYVLIASKLQNISLMQLGLNKPTKQGIMFWILGTCFMVMAIISLKIIFPEGIFYGVSKNKQAFLYLIPFYILIGTFLQELIFRGYVFARTSKLFSKNTSIIINIILFSIFHLPYFVQYRSNLIYLSIIAGACWSLMYAKYPNLFLAWISHGVVGSLNLLLLQKF